MGGRGSSGGGFKMPSFTGSAKQVSWAKSIIQEGLDTIKRNIALETSRSQKSSGYKAEAKKSIKAWKSVQKSLTSALSAGAGKEIPASRIIDRRNTFNGSGVLRAYNAERQRNR